MNDSRSVLARLQRPEFPRTNTYDVRWIARHQMGPHPLWLAESLGMVLEIQPGMRVLDLGCGNALTSIFYAKEFGATVWAADLWIDPSSNWERVRDAGLEDLILPIKAEAHALPFAEGYFDAIVSTDAYHYFGTDDLYLEDIVRFLRPEGRIGIIVPGVPDELHQIPDTLREVWDPSFWSFHSPEWWRRHWERAGVVEVEIADRVPDGYALWREWSEALEVFDIETADTGPEPGFDLTLLKADTDGILGFTRVVARRTAPAG